KENKIKKEYTYNMAESHFLARNKEIFTHDLFVNIKFPYLFLHVSLCSRFQSFVQYAYTNQENLIVFDVKTLWFVQT
ncbi:MAG: hypothetical protein ACREBA_06065, partial [Nitrosotalea sp.]